MSSLLEVETRKATNPPSVSMLTDLDDSAIALAARLKTLGVESIMAERNAHAGDNWALRYDSMRFHIPTSFCHLPYMSESRSINLDGRTA